MSKRVILRTFEFSKRVAQWPALLFQPKQISLTEESVVKGVSKSDIGMRLSVNWEDSHRLLHTRYVLSFTGFLFPLFGCANTVATNPPRLRRIVISVHGGIDLLYGMAYS